MFERIKDSLIRALLWGLLISSLVATITNLAWAFSVVSPTGSKAAWFGAISFDFAREQKAVSGDWAGEKEASYA